MQFKTLAVPFHVNIPLLWAQGLGWSRGTQAERAGLCWHSPCWRLRSHGRQLGSWEQSPMCMSAKPFQTSRWLPVGFSFSRWWRKIVVRTWEGKLPEFIRWRRPAGTVTISLWLCPSEGDAASKGFIPGDTLTSMGGRQIRHRLPSQQTSCPWKEHCSDPLSGNREMLSQTGKGKENPLEKSPCPCFPLGKIEKEMDSSLSTKF